MFRKEQCYFWRFSNPLDAMTLRFRVWVFVFSLCVVLSWRNCF